MSSFGNTARTSSLSTALGRTRLCRRTHWPSGELGAFGGYKPMLVQVLMRMPSSGCFLLQSFLLEQQCCRLVFLCPSAGIHQVPSHSSCCSNGFCKAKLIHLHHPFLRAKTALTSSEAQGYGVWLAEVLTGTQ